MPKPRTASRVVTCTRSKCPYSNAFFGPLPIARENRPTTPPESSYTGEPLLPIEPSRSDVKQCRVLPETSTTLPVLPKGTVARGVCYEPNPFRGSPRPRPVRFLDRNLRPQTPTQRLCSDYPRFALMQRHRSRHEVIVGEDETTVCEAKTRPTAVQPTGGREGSRSSDRFSDHRADIIIYLSLMSLISFR